MSEHEGVTRDDGSLMRQLTVEDARCYGARADSGMGNITLACDACDDGVQGFTLLATAVTAG